MANLEVEYML